MVRGGERERGRGFRGTDETGYNNGYMISGYIYHCFHPRLLSKRAGFYFLLLTVRLSNDVHEASC